MQLKRISKGTLLLWLVLTMLAAGILLIAAHTRGKSEFEKLSRGFYSEDIVKVNILEMNDKNELQRIIKKAVRSGKTNICFRNDLETGKDIRGVCYHGEIEKPIMKEGRFFSEEECFSEKKIALAGSGFEKEFIYRGKKRYMKIAGEEFEVLGILGTKQESRYDYMVFLPMQAAIVIYNVDGTYIFDGTDKETIACVAEGFADEIRKYTEYVEQSASGESSFAGFGNMDNTSGDTLGEMYIVMLFSFFLAAVSGIGFWLRYRYQEIQVKRMLGGSSFCIIRDMLKQFLGIWLPAYLMGSGIVSLLRIQIIKYPVHTGDYLAALAGTVVPGVIMLLCYLIRELYKRQTGAVHL